MSVAYTYFQNHLIFLKMKNDKADSVMEIMMMMAKPCGMFSP